MRNLYLFIFSLQERTGQIIPFATSLQRLKQLQQEVSDNVLIINNRYSGLTSKFQEDVNSRLNSPSLQKIYQNIESDLSRLSQRNEASAPPCAENLENRLSSLSISSRKDLTECSNMAVAKLASNITLEAEMLIAKANEMQGEVSGRIASCVKGNLVDEAGLALCLLAQVNPVEGYVSGFGQEVERTISKSESVAQETVFDFTNCVFNIESELQEAYDDIVTSLNQCESGVYA